MTFSNRTSPGHQARTPTRRESASPFRPRDSGGGGPLELAQRANRGGGGAGRGASLSLSKILFAGRSERTCLDMATTLAARRVLRPLHHPASQGGPPPPLSRWRMKRARFAGVIGAAVVAIRHTALTLGAHEKNRLPLL